MARPHLLKPSSSIGVIFVFSAVALSSCGKDQGNHPPLDGSGGNVGGGGEGGSGGADHQGTGGAAPSGGAACISQIGSGGQILLNACPQWNDDGLQDVRCGASLGGHGGEGTVPALARICEHRNLDDGKGTSRQYLACLDEAGVTGDPCRDNQEELVRECLLTPLAFCETSPDDVCQEVMAACPGVSFGACYFGLTDDGLVDDDAEIACFRDEISEDETCEARFLRCAWDY